MLRLVAAETARRDGTLAAFWPLARNYLDHSGRCVHCTSSGTFSVAGLYGRSCHQVPGTLSFGGGGDFDYDYGTPLSVSLWLCRTAPPAADYSPLLARQQSYTPSVRTTRGWDLTLVRAASAPSSSGYREAVRFRLTGDSENSLGVGVQAELNPDTSFLYGWMHLACTYDGSGSAYGMRVYVNGRRVAASVDCDNNVVSASPGPGPVLSLGGGEVTPDHFYDSDGLGLSFVRVYERELSPNDVAGLRRREAPLPTWKKSLFETIPPSSSCPFWVSGCVASSGSATLYLAQKNVSGSLPLAARGWDLRTAQVSLYEGGHLRASGQSPLWVSGVFRSLRAVPLVLRALDWSPWGYEGPLYVSGSARPNAVSHATLYAAGVPAFRAATLFLAGGTVDDTVRNMNLWVGGRPGVAGGAAGLFVCNTLHGTSGSADLYLRVGGMLQGGQESREGMPLYLKRPFEFAAPLVLLGEGNHATASAGLYAGGGGVAFASASLAVPDTLAALHPSAALYTHGW